MNQFSKSESEYNTNTIRNILVIFIKNIVMSALQIYIAYEGGTCTNAPVPSGNPMNTLPATAATRANEVYFIGTLKISKLPFFEFEIIASFYLSLDRYSIKVILKVISVSSKFRP